MLEGGVTCCGEGVSKGERGNIPLSAQIAKRWFEEVYNLIHPNFITSSSIYRMLFRHISRLAWLFLFPLCCILVLALKI